MKVQRRSHKHDETREWILRAQRPYFAAHSCTPTTESPCYLIGPDFDRTGLRDRHRCKPSFACCSPSDAFRTLLTVTPGGVCTLPQAVLPVMDVLAANDERGKPLYLSRFISSRPPPRSRRDQQSHAVQAGSSLVGGQRRLLRRDMAERRPVMQLHGPVCCASRHCRCLLDRRRLIVRLTPRPVAYCLARGSLEPSRQSTHLTWYRV